jgi:phospholipid/cholesterol/gamma-HCH transport system ATP-binding protein
MGIGENITFICDGRAEWQGSNKQIMDADNKSLEDFIFASDILRHVKMAHDASKKRQ